jgi:hypothetical protein
MRHNKSSHRQCPPRLHRPPHTQNTGTHLAVPYLSELGFKVMRMRCLRGDLCAGSLMFRDNNNSRIYEVVVRVSKIHPQRFAHAAHFRVHKLHPEGCVPVERARCLAIIAPALRGRPASMRHNKSSHRQCPPRLHRPPHTQNTGTHLAVP